VGDSAENMDVRAELLDNPRLIAGSITQSATDNLNIQRMADMAETKLGVLGDLTCSDFYQKIVTGVGEGVAARKSRQDTLETMVRQLGNQRDAFSGIDINEQSALLLVYQRMFQSMSKYISVQEQTVQYLVDMI
jgi:flagellar hook-associated protein 1 FlgK